LAVLLFVTELVVQQLRHVVDKLPRLRLGYFRQLIAPDLYRLWFGKLSIGPVITLSENAL
jgi:hypothetical protein